MFVPAFLFQVLWKFKTGILQLFQQGFLHPSGNFRDKLKPLGEQSAYGHKNHQAKKYDIWENHDPVNDIIWAYVKEREAHDDDQAADRQSQKFFDNGYKSVLDQAAEFSGSCNDPVDIPADGSGSKKSNTQANPVIVHREW